MRRLAFWIWGGGSGRYRLACWCCSLSSRCAATGASTDVTLLTKWVVVQLSAILGDSYLLAHCPVQFAAMRTKVADDLRWLQQRCDVVTLGQGISKLHLLQRMEWNPAGHRAAWRSRTFVVIGLLLAGLPALGVIASRLGARALSLLDATPLYPLQIAAGFVFLTFGVWYAVRTNGRQVDDSLALPAAAPGLTWSDYYASADPVANGQIAPEQTAGAQGLPAHCHEVYNRGSLLTDHDSYLGNQDQVVPWLLNDLVAAAYGPVNSPRLVRDDDIRPSASSHGRLWKIARTGISSIRPRHLPRCGCCAGQRRASDQAGRWSAGER